MTTENHVLFDATFQSLCGFILSDAESTQGVKLKHDFRLSRYSC